MLKIDTYYYWLFYYTGLLLESFLLLTKPNFSTTYPNPSIPNAKYSLISSLDMNIYINSQKHLQNRLVMLNALCVGSRFYSNIVYNFQLDCLIVRMHFIHFCVSYVCWLSFLISYKMCQEIVFSSQLAGDYALIFVGSMLLFKKYHTNISLIVYSVS